MTQNCGPEGGREGEREGRRVCIACLHQGQQGRGKDYLPTSAYDLKCLRVTFFYGRWHHMYILCFEKMGHLRLREPHVNGQRESGGGFQATM